MSSSKIRPTVAHIILDYLHLSESWIYHQIITQQKFDSFVLARNRFYPDLYPRPKVYVYPKLFEIIPPNKLFFPLKKTLSLVQRALDLTHHQQNYFLNQLTALKPSLIHAHYGPTGFLALPLATRLNLPLVVSFYGSDAYSLSTKKLWQNRYLQLFRGASLILSKGPTMTEKLIDLGCPSQKVISLDHGINLIDIPFQVRPSTPHPRILIASRHEPIKGIDFALKSFQLAQQKLPHLSLSIVGNGSQTPKLISFAKDLKLKNYHFYPFMPQPKLIKFAQTHHIYLHPSLTQSGGVVEGNPTSIIERAASGMPVIATKHADIPLMVKHGKTGLLVKENDLQALAQAIVTLASHQNLWPKYAQAGRLLAETSFDTIKQTAKREQLYQSLI